MMLKIATITNCNYHIIVPRLVEKYSSSWAEKNQSSIVHMKQMAYTHLTSTLITLLGQVFKLMKNNFPIIFTFLSEQEQVQVIAKMAILVILSSFPSCSHLKER